MYGRLLYFENTCLITNPPNECPMKIRGRLASWAQQLASSQALNTNTLSSKNTQSLWHAPRATHPAEHGTLTYETLIPLFKQRPQQPPRMIPNPRNRVIKRSSGIIPKSHHSRCLQILGEKVPKP
jgi:hypothetical protein